MSDRYIDLTVVLIYMVAITLVGLWVGRNKGSDKDSYFVGGRKFSWPLVGLSIYATNISVGAFVGSTGLAYKVGFAAANPELLGGFFLAISAIIFIPMYLRTRLYTIPQFLEMRFDGATKILYGVSFVLRFLLTGPAGIYAAAIFALDLFDFQITGWNIFFAGALIAGTVGLYSVVGGLTSVVVTDAVQVVVMLIGGFAVVIIGLVKIGGIGAFYDIAGPESFDLLRPYDADLFQWDAMVFGQSIHSAFFAFCAINILQRALGARDVDNAQKGMLLGAFVKMFALLIFAVPGILGTVFYPDIADPDFVYGNLVRDLLWPGFSGLVLAAGIAALMSSADSGINAMAGVIALDIYPAVRKKASEKEAILFSKIFSGAMVAMWVVVAPFFLAIKGEGVYEIILKVSGYMIMPAGICFLYGRFFKRINAQGALATMIIGIISVLWYVLGTTIDGLNFLVPSLIGDLPFYRFLPYFFLFLTAIIFGVSFAFPAPPPEKLECVKAVKDHSEAMTKDKPFYSRFYFWFTLYVIFFVGIYLVSELILSKPAG